MTYLTWSVDIGFCCNETFHYWKTTLMAGYKQWCCAVLEMKNISVIAP